MMISIPPTFLEQVDEAIQQYLGNEDLSTDQLAELLFMSSSQLYRKIKQKTGCSPSTYIRQKRLKHGYYLILRSELTLSTIAYRVGFGSISYFSKCFSDYYGFPPSELR